jgi:hypothetical protein
MLFEYQNPITGMRQGWSSEKEHVFLISPDKKTPGIAAEGSA